MPPLLLFFKSLLHLSLHNTVRFSLRVAMLLTLGLTLFWSHMPLYAAPVLQVVLPTDTRTPTPSKTPVPSNTPPPTRSPTTTDTPTITPTFTNTPTRTPSPTPIPASCFPAKPATLLFAVIGDYGQDNKEEEQVAQLVKSWQPELIITTGDNSYTNGKNYERYDKNVGQYYWEYIYPYTGTFTTTIGGPIAPVWFNRFWPAVGNHDWEGTKDLEGFHDFFDLPNNERYYTFTNGPIEFFAIDSDPNEPDGMTKDSPQATWLRSHLLASQAKWKIVYFHHPSYSSGNQHGPTQELQWPFKDWGASIVLNGHEHVYERFEFAGFAYIINGLGGAGLHGFGNPTYGSQVRYVGEHGAQRVTANPSGMTFQFYNISGQLIDSYSVGCPTGNYITPTPTATPTATITPTPTHTPTHTATPTDPNAPTPDPACTIRINQGADYTNQREITIQLDLAGVATMQISNDASFTGSIWQPYQPTSSWLLPDVGARVERLVVYVRVRDANQAMLCNGVALIDDILYDRLPPALNVNLSQGILQITVNDQEGGSGVSQMQVATQPDFSDGVWQAPFRTYDATSLSVATLYLRAQDHAGNLSQPLPVFLVNAQSLYLPIVLRDEK